MTSFTATNAWKWRLPAALPVDRAESNALAASFSTDMPEGLLVRRVYPVGVTERGEVAYTGGTTAHTPA